MKRCFITLIVFCGLFKSAFGQSPSASIDSLVKYQVIKAKERPTLETEVIRYKGIASYRVAILGGLESMLMQKTFHVDPHRNPIFISYQNSHLSRKNQDNTNSPLRLLLQKINKAGLLTDRIYTYTSNGIYTGRYIDELQMISSLAEMSSRLEWLAPEKLLPVAEELNKDGIVSDSSFLRLENDIRNGKIESAFQLNDYCRLDRIFDLTKYDDDPKLWLEQIHRDIASILPGLSFTDFSYTTVPDTSFSLPGVRFKVSLVCNGHTYKHTSIAFTSFKSRQGSIRPKDIFVEDFYRIFNKVLTDQQSPLRLHAMMFSPGKTTNDHFRYFSLIALSSKQAEVFMNEPCRSLLMLSMDNYDNMLTSARIDSTLTGWRKMGLFAHLSNVAINKAIDNAEADNQFSIDNLLANFPGVIYPLDFALMSPRYPYVDVLTHLGTITHGVFNPTHITQRKVAGGVKLQYEYKGKIQSYTFTTKNGWLDEKFGVFMTRLSDENNLPGKFYQLRDADAIIYLTKQQHEEAVKQSLLEF